MKEPKLLHSMGIAQMDQEIQNLCWKSQGTRNTDRTYWSGAFVYRGQTQQTQRVVERCTSGSQGNAW